MKQTLIIGGILLVVVVGYFVFTQNTETNVVTDPAVNENMQNEDGETPQAKIDPRVACESALAYMTFASGEEAETFVEACVDGEHPEVIERYTNDMGLDGATI